MNIKKVILLLSVIFFQISATNAQQIKSAHKFTLRGKIHEKHTRFLELDYSDQNGTWIKDTCSVKNGTFVFTGRINGITWANLTGNTESNSSDDPNFAMIFLEPGQMRCSLAEDDFKNIKLTGSLTEHEYAILEKEKKPLNEKEDRLSALLTKIRQTEDTSSAMRDKASIIREQYLQCKEGKKQIDYGFINTHPNSYLSPYLMRYYFGSRMLSLDSAELFFNNFNQKVQKSQYGKLIHDEILARKSSQKGQPAPAFTRIDLNGKETDLSSFKGKEYVLLDFWASWCEPCRAMTPKLQKLYHKFHDKGLEIISVSWDFNKKSWQDAIKRDGIKDWHNLYDDISHNNSPHIGKLYDISSIPALILIDKKGIIDGRYAGSGGTGDEADLYNELNKIFAN